jgi:hypothetical protein
VWHRAILLTIGLGPVVSGATEPSRAASARCRRLLSEARSKADLLGAPRFEAQAFRQPVVGDPGGAPALPSQGAQVRAGVGWSPIDRLKAGLVVDAAEAGCAALEARDLLEGILEQGAGVGEEAALTAQAAVLESGLARADALLERARERQARRIDTLVDLDELEGRVARLRSDLEGVRRRLAERAVQGPATASVPITRLVSDYEQASLASAKAQSDERRLDAWRVDLRAGAVPWPKTDWFGMASVSWSLGAGDQARSEHAVLAARTEELETARDELRGRVGRFTAAVREGLPALERELAVVRERFVMNGERRRLAAEGSDAMARMQDRYVLDGLELEGRVRFLETLLAARRAVLGGA